MKARQATAVLLSVVGLLLCSAVRADVPSAIQAAAGSVIRISAADGSACATGFVLRSGELVTNAHVARSICSVSGCAAKIEQQLKDSVAVLVYSGRLDLKAATAGLDLAVFTVPEKLNLPGLDPGRSAAAGSAVYAIGYPACGSLKISAGAVTQIADPYLHTSTRGKHGSSGSPIVDAQGDLVAVVDEADSVSGALSSLLGGGTFENRAVAADYVYSTATEPESERLSREWGVLVEHYRSWVVTQSGPFRFLASLRFLAVAQGSLDDVIRSPSSDAILLRLAADQNRSLGALGTLPISGPFTTQHQQLQLLVIAAAAERGGLQQRLGIALDLRSLFELFKQQGWSAEHLEQLRKLLAGFEQTPYPGLDVTLLAAAAGALLVLVIGALWFWTLGYVFGTAPGGFFKRIGIMILVGAFWPISLLFYRKRRG